MKDLPEYVSKVIGKVNVDTIAFEEAAKKNNECPECNGSGRYQQGTMRVCNSCHGEEIKYKTYEIWCNIKDHFYDYEGVNLLGSVEAKSFHAACDRFFWNNGFYVSEDLAYKGCKLYKTQMEACCDGDEGVLA